MHEAHLLLPETLLQLAPGVRTRFDAAGHVLLDSPDGTVLDMGPRGFDTLALFAQPIALGAALERLEGEGPSSTHYAPTLNVINMLLEEGALLRPAAGRGPTSGWADPVEHARMLHEACPGVSARRPERRTPTPLVPECDGPVPRSRHRSLRGSVGWMGRNPPTA